MKHYGFAGEEQKWNDTEYFFQGTKPVSIVLIHGWSSLPRQVKDMAKALNNRGYTVYVPKLTGHGSRPEDLEQATWEHWINDVRNAASKMKEHFPHNKIFLGGTSMGGNLALLVSQEVFVHGIISIGTPIILKKHILIWLFAQIVPWFKSYIRKRYPEKVRLEKEKLGYTSYQYYPAISLQHMFKIVTRSAWSLHKVTSPALILQVRTDYLVSRWSPRILNWFIASKKKTLMWLDSDSNSHIVITNQMTPVFDAVEDFINKA